MTMRYNVVDPRDFFERTANLEMRDNPAMQRFLAALPERARICDAGCGSGRDAAHFAALGHDVLAFDAHPELVRLARERLGMPAMRMTFQDVDFEARFDAIWACASLLHLPPPALADALGRLARALTPGGLLYASFKTGTGCRTTESGRFFNDQTPESAADLIAGTPGLELVETFLTGDQLGRAQGWTNVLARRAERL